MTITFATNTPHQHTIVINKYPLHEYGELVIKTCSTCKFELLIANFYDKDLRSLSILLHIGDKVE